MKIKTTIMVFFLCFCSISYAQNIEISGKVGGFIFTSDDPDYTDYWSSNGFFAGGRLSYYFGKQSVLLFDIDDIKTEKESYIFGYPCNTQGHILAFLFLYERKLLKDAIVIPYIAGGFGISRLSGTVTVDYLITNVDWTDFTYKVLFGLDMGKYLFLEASYMSGGRNGNTGVSLLGGVRGQISKL